uniref:Integrase core domain containing protein n=1 Tax=Solanum tuberosum TaxID=4113 RepID=M1DJ94_SOLTU
MCRGEKQNLQEKGLVQRSTEPIDGQWFSPRIVNSVRRSQIPSTNPRPQTVDQSTDRRYDPWMEALEEFTKCQTTDVDYDEQLRQQRARELVTEASSSMPVSEVLPTVAIDVSTTDGAVRVADSTTDDAVLVDAGTTEGDPSVDLAGSGKSDPPTC